MRFIKSTFILLALICPFFLSAQAFAGAWEMSGTDGEGNAFNNTVTFNTDGTMTVDFGSDGTADVKATFTMDGDVASVSDTSSESPCYGKVGQYRMVMEGDQLTAILVADPCDARRADKMVMTRK